MGSLPSINSIRYLQRILWTTNGLLRNPIRSILSGGSALGAVSLLGLSLLPLASLLLMLPAVLPEESILSNTLQPTRSRWRRLGRRLFAILSGVLVLVALLVFAIELIGAMKLKNPYFAVFAKKLLPSDLYNSLPETLVTQWPYVLLIVYASDLLILLTIGKVPLQYNIRNLKVRWRISLLTGLAFTTVVALLTIMLAFLNGLDRLTSTTGIVGNVFILSDGATDELFSNFSYGSADTIQLATAINDLQGNPLPVPIRPKMMNVPTQKEQVPMLSKETYYTISQSYTLPDGTAKRRFVQVRGMKDPAIAKAVHGVVMIEGDFLGDEDARKLADGTDAVPVVLGEGAAMTQNTDPKRDRCHVGDVFRLGDLKMIVVGIMKSEGTTFGSEIWAKQDRIGKQFGKSSPTTIVMRVNTDDASGAKIMAHYLSNEFKDPRVKAVPEQQYYSELSKTNDFMLVSVTFLAAIIAIGGIFGVMNTMFAAISQRMKDIGVLRILGFKRWQILVSFLLESLSIALIGGLLGVIVGSFADGFSMNFIVSGSGGGGKSVVLKMFVDSNIIAIGILFTIVMGRLGGLLPALSGMQLGILESLR